MASSFMEQCRSRATGCAAHAVGGAGGGLLPTTCSGEAEAHVNSAPGLTQPGDPYPGFGSRPFSSPILSSGPASSAGQPSVVCSRWSHAVSGATKMLFL